MNYHAGIRKSDVRIDFTDVFLLVPLHDRAGKNISFLFGVDPVTFRMKIFQEKSNREKSTFSARETNRPFDITFLNNDFSWEHLLKLRSQ